MLEIKNVTKIFNKDEGVENQKIALDNIYLKINKSKDYFNKKINIII